MKLNKRKGFTIVELVIVIAVIAILAAVLIPNISNLVKKANASADESLVRNLNTALSMDVEKHQTMDAALEAALKNGGYELTTIVTKNKDNKILWDSKNDCFVYMKKGVSKPTYLPNTQEVKDVKDWDLFEIVDTVPGLENQKYSIYLTGNDKTVDTAVSVGFDAGKNTVARLKYENTSNTAKNVIINTNGGTLEVNAPKDTVNHFGKTVYLLVRDVYVESYHENGVFEVAKIEKGHIVLEKTAVAGSIEVGTVSTAASLEIKNGAKVSIVAKGNTESTITNNSNSEVKEATEEEKTNSSKFAGGFGTKESPYLVSTKAHFDEILNLYKNGNSEKKYFSLLSDVHVGDLTEWDKACETRYEISFVGNNHTITASPTGVWVPLFGIVSNSDFTDVKIATDNEYLWSFCWRIYNVTMTNIDVVYPESVVTAGYGFSPYCCIAGDNVEFINCDIQANIKIDSKYAGLFVGNYIDTENTVVKFVNCTFSGEFRGPQVSMFIGNTNNSTLNPTFVVENCSNYGTIIGTVSATYFATNGGTKYQKFESSAIMQGVTKAEGSLSVSNLDLGQVTLTVDENNQYVLNSTLSSSYKYKVSLVSGIVLLNSAGEKVGSSYVMIDKNFNSANNVATGLYKSKVISDNKLDTNPQYGNDTDSMNGRNFVYDSSANVYVLESFDGTYYGNVNNALEALVYIYDSNNVLVGTLVVK